MTVDDTALNRLRRANSRELDAPVLVIAAHPDDETIGAGALIAQLRQPVILHVTNGAPKDRKFVSEHFEGTLEEYAHARHAEAVAALSIAGVPEHSVRTLAVTDLEAAFHLGEIARAVSDAIESIRPALVVTHAYEGGHPDHDAVAFAVHAAAAMATDRPPVVEVALYFARGDSLVSGEFCGDSGEVFTIDLDDEQRASKLRMFDSFATQRDVLAQFTIASERFRVAPQYDFREPPHEGRLWYEVLGWPLTGEVWRRSAATAMTQLGLGDRAWL